MTFRNPGRVYSTPLNSLRRTLGEGAAAWHQFWFQPADPLLLGVIRMLAGWMLFYNLLIWTLELDAFFGRNGLQPLETVRRLYASRPVVSFWLWIDDSLLWPMHFACLAVAAMFCMGLFTRLTSVLSFLITISYSQRVPIANFGLDQILGMLCLYLTLAPAGAAVSLDVLLLRWWRRKRHSTGLESEVHKCLPDREFTRYASVRMSMRLIQLHLCAIYFWAGLAKLKGPSWWTGEAMWRVVANYEYQTLDLTWMARIPWLPYLLAHITIVWELFFAVLIWRPRLRPLMLAVGLAMHLGIGLFLGMWTFGLIMIIAYLAFADPDIWRQRLSRLLHHRQNSAVALENAGSNQAATTSVAAESNASLCIVAGSGQDRSALRQYFRSHRFECCVTVDFNTCLNLLSRQQADALIVHAAGFLPTELNDFVADAADLLRGPILVLLSPRQQILVRQLEQIPGAVCIKLPASLQEIRKVLELSLAARATPTADLKISAEE